MLLRNRFSSKIISFVSLIYINYNGHAILIIYLLSKHERLAQRLLFAGYIITESCRHIY